MTTASDKRPSTTTVNGSLALDASRVSSPWVRVYVNVNEDGEDYDSHDTLEAALAVQDEFPNDTIQVRVTGPARVPTEKGSCCTDDDGPFEVDADGYCVGCGTRRADKGSSDE